MRVAVRLFLWMTLLTGVLYPLLITLIAQVGMREKADGGIVVVQGKARGALLIGQKFTSDKYFWGRPSAVDYNPLPSGGSQLGPTSSALAKAVDERKKVFGNKEPIPSELLFASGSGLDPHITPEAALFQAARIVKARGIGEKEIELLIHDLTERGLFGPPRINVLKLNLALDKLVTK